MLKKKDAMSTFMSSQTGSGNKAIYRSWKPLFCYILAALHFSCFDPGSAACGPDPDLVTTGEGVN